MFRLHGQRNNKLALTNLKNSIIHAPILTFSYYNKQFIIRTDASKDSLDGVLLQVKDKDKLEHSVYFVNRTLEKS